MSLNIPSLAKQSLLLEFASLKHASPEGVYVTITPGDASLWSGVLFVREGPYKGAVLRFQISFLFPFPAAAPLITFSSDVFHPLLTSLTTLTYTTSNTDGETVSATDDERLPPGGFSLRHGFPSWFGRARKTSLDAARSPNSDSNSGLGSSTCSRPQPTMDVTVYDVLEYMRMAFSSEELIASIPLDAAANRSAYHAYRSFKGITSTVASRTTSPEPATSRQRQWNWEGVWEERLKRGVQSTQTEALLFGNVGANDDMIRFSDLNDDVVQKIRTQMLKS